MSSRSACFLFAVLLAGTGCVDTVHDDAVAALGGETAGVRPGPLHRPGQPCLTCHSGQGPGNADFSVAGTVYLLAHQEDVAPNVSVILEDIRGSAVLINTNEAGNFFINASDWRPTYPMTTKLIYAGKVNKPMNTSINRSGSCSDCHTEPPGTKSPGRVYVATNGTQLQKALAAP